MDKNKLIIAAAGSGKTTFLVTQAMKIVDNNILITTYTEANKNEIRKKFDYHIPGNVCVQTWFAFLLKHGVRPYQSIMHKELHDKNLGFYLTDRPSGIRFIKNGIPHKWGEKDFFKYYFTNDFKIYSDKISKFIIECNKKTEGEIINRISRIFPNIYIDEIQDLAGWDLEIVKLLINSNSRLLMVGDPRQVTYLTHHPIKYKKYREGKISDFIQNEINKKGGSLKVDIDTSTLQRSHRNNAKICSFSSQLYKNYESSYPCECNECRSRHSQHEGIFLVKPNDVKIYLNKFKPVQLRWNIEVGIDPNFEAFNFGKSKGMTFDHVLIYPTRDMKKWILDNHFDLNNSTRAKFYVAITRARHSVGIIFDYSRTKVKTTGVELWKNNI